MFEEGFFTPEPGQVVSDELANAGVEQGQAGGQRVFEPRYPFLDGLRKRGYPYSILSTGGPSTGTPTLCGENP